MAAPSNSRAPSDAAPHRIDISTFVRLTSLDYDRVGKRALYAAVREHWIVDLQHEVVERYLPANANSPTSVRPGEALAPDAYPDVEIDLHSIFAAARQGRR